MRGRGCCMRFEEFRTGRAGKVLTVIVSLLVVVLIAGYLFFGYNRFSLRVIPVGTPEMTLGYGDPYLEQGAVLQFSGSRFWQTGFAPDVQVRVEGTVDTNTTGDYTVAYSADYYWWHGESSRTIHVIDDIPPELTLEGASEVYVLPV